MALQMVGSEPVHFPAWQVSFVVQASLSLQAVPSDAVLQSDVD